jgi:hypothetical protein
MLTGCFLAEDLEFVEGSRLKLAVGGHETRVDTLGVLDTGLVEAGLGDGVVLLQEVEVHDVTNLGDDLIGRVDELPRSSNRDLEER